MQESKPNQSIPDLFKISHPFVLEYEEAIENGNCVEVLRRIAEDPGRAPEDFIEILLTVGVNMAEGKYQGEELAQIKLNMDLATKNLIEHVDRILEGSQND